LARYVHLQDPNITAHHAFGESFEERTLWRTSPPPHTVPARDIHS